MANDILLKIEGLRASVEDKEILKGVDLVIRKGEIHAVMGPNGAGKSTMLNAVAGVYGVDEGKIFIDGVDVTGLPEYKRAKFIGRVFQDPMMGTAATMQIEESLAMAARRGKPRTLRIGITNAEREEYKKQLATLGLGLEDRMTATVGLLSGGQRQAVTLLMATLKKPKLLLLDEHTAALDPKTAAKATGPQKRDPITNTVNARPLKVLIIKFFISSSFQLSLSLRRRSIFS